MIIPSKSFTVSYNGVSNVLTCELFITKACPENISLNQPIKIEDYNPKKYLAIWDTGATNTAISGKVARECDLKPIGVINVNHAGGSSLANTYIANLWLPNKTFILNVFVSEAPIFGADILIGMDIIIGGDFAVTHKDGKTVFSFRTPSIECIDFVKNPYKGDQPIQSSKIVGRNSPCPCGSGKKYKKCCGK